MNFTKRYAKLDKEPQGGGQATQTTHAPAATFRPKRFHAPSSNPAKVALQAESSVSLAEDVEATLVEFRGLW